MRRGRSPLCLTLVLAASLAPAAAARTSRDRTTLDGRAVAADSVALAIRDKAGGGLKRFYADRNFRALWVPGGRIGRAADTLVGFLQTAELDGLDADSYDIDNLREAITKARGGNPEAVARAELKLSKTFARYVRDQRRSRDERMIYAERGLKPKRLKPEAVMRAAAFPKSFDDYVADMGWMSDHYVRVRAVMASVDNEAAPKQTMARLRLNLDRARLLPGAWTRHVVVDASSGRLWYYEAGRQVGTMRVVVGARETQTPMLAGMLQWAIVNPYWNVPTYLAAKSMAPKVLAGRSLASMRIEALSDWGAAPRRLDASEVDWAAVAAGREEVRLRELPGAGNSMGRVKFLFPNDEGIYLHDTPERDLLKRSDRHLSNGCIRLEKAAELARWLLQRPLPAGSKTPEQAVVLPVQVPVYLTYITVVTDGGVSFREDVYGRDG